MVLRIANTVLTMLPHVQKLYTMCHKNCSIVVCSVWYTPIPTHHYEYPADVVGIFNFLLST